MVFRCSQDRKGKIFEVRTNPRFPLEPLVPGGSPKDAESRFLFPLNGRVLLGVHVIL